MALAEIVRNAAGVIDAIGWVAIGAVVSWTIVSWFLAGGILSVFTERPRGRADTARCFGAGGTSHFLVFARLGVDLGHLPPAGRCSSSGSASATPATRWSTPSPWARWRGRCSSACCRRRWPHVVVSTIIDYARAELVLRRPAHESLGAVRATIRATGYVFRRPVAIAHVLLYWLAFAAISFGFAWVAHDHAMLGFYGAAALFALRQGVVLLRLAARVAVMAGQVELTSTRPPPPREVVPVERAS